MAIGIWVYFGAEDVIGVGGISSRIPSIPEVNTDPHINHDPPFDQSQHVTVQKRLEFKLSMACQQRLKEPHKYKYLERAIEYYTSNTLKNLNI